MTYLGTKDAVTVNLIINKSVIIKEITVIEALQKVAMQPKNYENIIEFQGLNSKQSRSFSTKKLHLSS
jgi:hypothetical protein